jgi:hypothetical protein
MNIIKKPKKKFITGESRYCQKCGKESRKLFQVTNETKKIDQLQCCPDCKVKYDKKQKAS